MQTMTLQEFEAKLGASFDSLRGPAAWDEHTTRFLTVPEAGKLTALGRTLAEMVNAKAGSTLVMYTGTGNFPSSENTYLLQVFRSAFSEHRTVREVPGHVFTPDEHNDCWTMITLCLQNRWDFMLLARTRDMILWGSHDEYIEIRTSEASYLQQFRTALSRLGLREIELAHGPTVPAAELAAERKLETTDQTLQDIAEEKARREKYERLDQFLVQTRELAQMHQGNIAILERLGRSILNTLLEATEWDEHVRRNALLQELRELAKSNPEDAVVRESLARGICFVLKFAGDDQSRVSGLLDELRRLMVAYPDDPIVRVQLAVGLYSAFPTIAQDTLLQQSRDLAKQYPQDAAIQELLAVSLHRVLYYAIQEVDAARIHSLLEELRTLVKLYPEEHAIREQFASGLTTAISYAGSENQALRDSLITELRALAASYPDEPAIASCLADAEAMTHGATAQ